MCFIEGNKKVVQVTIAKPIRLHRSWLRAFRRGRNVLTPLYYGDRGAWKVLHKAFAKPTVTNMSGLHGYTSRNRVRMYNEIRGTFLGFGQCVVGRNGARCEFGIIESVSLPTFIDSSIVDSLRKTYPGVKFTVRTK